MNAGTGQQYLMDGFMTLPLGMNEGIKPLLLVGKNQYQFGLNMSCRGGLLKTRPNFIDTETVLPDGKYQGTTKFSLNSGDRFVVVIDGYIHTIYLNVTGITPYTVVSHGQLLSPDVDKVYFTQADQYLLIQDGSSPVVAIVEKLHDFDTYSGRRDAAIVIPADRDTTPILDEEGEVTGLGPVPFEAEKGGRIPIGTHMQYAHGRIYLVPKLVPGTDIDGRRFFLAGDKILPSDTINVLWFTDDAYLSNGGAIILPVESGFIEGMGIVRASSSGTGYGSLVVFGRTGVSAFAVQASRQTWGEIDFSSVLFFDSGTLSSRSILNVNSDLFYRDVNGIRTIRQTATEAEGALSNKPISNEVSKMLSADTGEALPYVSFAMADNRMLITTQPVTVNNEQCFKGVISYDFASYYTSTESMPPVYDGVWTGLNFLEVLTARGESMDKWMYAFHKEADGGNRLFRLASEDAAYLDAGNTSPVVRVYTHPMDFQSSQDVKEFKAAELWIEDLKGEAEITVYYRIYGYKLWNRMNTITVNADMSDSDSLPQSRWRMRLNVDNKKAINTIDNVLTTNGHIFEFCLEWTGHLELVRFQVLANSVDAGKFFNKPYEVEAGAALVPGSGGEVLDNYTYEIGA